MRLANFLNPYAYALRIRRSLYRSGRLESVRIGIPVISIGNLTMGGTGKTPLTILIAQHIESTLQKKVGIVLRGYGRESKGQLQVHAPIDNSKLVGDEALALGFALPEAIIIVDEDRVRGAEQAKKLGAEVILLDDGFQHLHLQRDVNILLIDTEEGLGTVLPFGRAREDFSAVRDADIVLFTNVSNGPRAHKASKKVAPYVRPDALVAALHAVGHDLELLKTHVHISTELLQGARVLAVSSIAKPERFHRTVAACGATVLVHALPDHAEYTKHTVEEILSYAERIKADLIVTTTKDIVKSREYFNAAERTVPVLVLHLAIEWIENETGFLSAIDAVINSFTK